MSERGGQQDVARRVEELERYFRGDGLSLEGLQERIAGIPPDAVRGSDFFHHACINEKVTLEMIECLLDAFPDAVRSTDGHGPILQEARRCLPTIAEGPRRPFRWFANPRCVLLWECEDCEVHAGAVS